MKFLTFEQIQAQLRLDDAQATEEHNLLELYGNDAEDMVLNDINRSYTEMIDLYGEVPHPLVTAALMLVAASYQHREPVSPQNLYVVGYGYDKRVKPYMRLTTSSATNNNNEYGKHCNL